MITIIIALSGLGISIAGIGILIYQHRNAVEGENVAEDPFLFEEFFLMLKTRGILFWQTNLRDHIFYGFEKTLAWCEDAFKRVAAFLRLLRSRLRRRQLNGVNQEDRYWHTLNSWNTRRLKLRLRRKKPVAEE